MALPDINNAINFNDFTTANQKDIGKIYITGGGYVMRPFTGTGTDSKYGWQEMTWKTKPSRSSSFSLKNIDDIDIGLVARCEINFKYMNIQDYLALRKIVGRERHFLIQFFDVDSGTWVQRDMYCSDNSFKQLFYMDRKLIGAIDCPVKFVGTNNDVDTSTRYTITYNVNGGSGSPAAMSNISNGQQVRIRDNSGISNGTREFLGWSLSSTGELNYLANQSTSIWSNMTLFAKWGD